MAGSANSEGQPLVARDIDELLPKHDTTLDFRDALQADFDCIFTNDGGPQHFIQEHLADEAATQDFGTKLDALACDATNRWDRITPLAQCDRVFCVSPADLTSATNIP